MRIDWVFALDTPPLGEDPTSLDQPIEAFVLTKDNLGLVDAAAVAIMVTPTKADARAKTRKTRRMGALLQGVVPLRLGVQPMGDAGESHHSRGCEPGHT